MANPQGTPAADMLWGGRFTTGLSPLMVKFNDSLPVDRAMWKQDILGSIAYARANVATGVLTQTEFAQIESGLQEVAKEWEAGTFATQPNDEDIHTANERRLGEIIGKGVAGKLHTGRSRNDQCITDQRMWLRDQLITLERLLSDLLRVFTDRADSDIAVLMPGYTHLQRAQPIRWSYWLLSYAAAFADDLERLRAVFHRVNRSPLGSGALAGNSFDINRQAMATELGFKGVLPNSMAAVADRVFVLETMQWGSLLMLNLSRLAEDLIIYSSHEFGFVKISDGFSTGSSLMPQKRNADGLELLRGKCGRVFGQMAGVQMTIKSLPTSYAKDLQECTEPLFDQIQTVSDSLQIATGVLSTLTVNPDKMRAALTSDMLATEVADYLVRKKVPFRDAHHISGRCIALAEQEGIGIDSFVPSQWASIDERLEPDIVEILNYEKAVEAKNAEGGTSKKTVMEQVAKLRAILSEGTLDSQSK